MSISLQYQVRRSEEAHGTQAVAGSRDFAAQKDLKQALKTVFDNFTCPSCGGHRVDGSGVIVEIGKVVFFQEVTKKGWFSSKKYEEKRVRDVWRIYDISLKAGGLFGLFPPAGYMRCKSCEWKVKGGSNVRWLSLNDIFTGNF